MSDNTKLKEFKSKHKFVISFAVKTVCLVLAVTLIFTFVFNLHRMTGNQMFPSVRDGDLGVFYKLDNCYVNDVVLYENAEGVTTVGRIIAIEGQSVNFMDEGGYQVDGNVTYDEVPYETHPSKKKNVKYPVKLKEGEYFILNDFRSDTSDSREHGPVKSSKIKGKLLFQLRRRGF